MTEMEKMEKLVEATRRDLGVCRRYCELMGSSNLTEEARKRIDYLWTVHHSANTATTMDNFWKNLETEARDRELNESDIRKIKLYINNQLKKEDK